MKKILFLSLFVLISALSFGQQKKPYIRYVAPQVAEDYSLAVKNYFTIPRGPIPGFPAYVPDSLKCGALYSKTTVGLSDTLKSYNCNTGLWVTVSGSGGGVPVVGEIPLGAINGTNVTYTLANTPQIGTVQVYRNGLRMLVGVNNDYTISGTFITFNKAPRMGNFIQVDYFK